MKTIFHQKNGSYIMEQPYPVIEKTTDVIVKLEVGALCRTDVYVHMNTIPSNEVILGHECSGIIVEKGSDAGEFQIGDRVSINPFIGCGKCSHCQKNNFQLCLEQKMMGKEVDGVFSAFFKVDKRNVVKFSKNVSPQKAAFFEPVLAIAAVLKASYKKDDHILVYGKNRIAELTKKILVLNGYKDVTCMIPTSNEPLYDFVIETVPTTEGFNGAVSVLKPGGTLVIKSRIFNHLPVDLFQILQKEIKIETAYYYDDIAHAVEMIENGLEIDDIIGNTHSFDEFERVFQDSLKAEALKTYLEVR
jgi:L-iditol 2-dehydrogenase